MSKTKDLYFDAFANYDYMDMPNVDFEMEYRMWEIKEERIEKMLKIFEKI